MAKINYLSKLTKKFGRNVFPDCRKLAKNLPIPKKGTKKDPETIGQYRICQFLANFLKSYLTFALTIS